MLEVAKTAVEAARAAGADFADARAGTDESESLTVRNQEMEGIDRSTSTGVGIRVLVGGRWGFASTSRLDDGEIDRDGPARGGDGDRGPAAARRRRRRSRPSSPSIASWRTPVKEDPFTVPLEEKVALLMEASRQMQGVPGLSFAEAGLDFFRRSTWFASSDGAADRAGRHELGRRHRGHRGRRRRHAAAELPQLVPGTREGGGVRAHPDPRSHRGSRAHRRRGGRPAVRAGVPERGHDARAGLGPDGAADPRVDRAPDRARPRARHGRGLRRLVVALAGRSRLGPIRERSRLGHRRCHAAGRARHVRLRRRGRAGPAGADHRRRHVRELPDEPGDGCASSDRRPTRRAGPTGGATCRSSA